jgi:uncharacterized protein YcaQ
VEGLSASQARRIALAAQGFADPRPRARIDRRHVRKVFDRVGLVQIDSVNVLVRSQELPLFARLGPHPRHLLNAMAHDGELFEYWGHEASLIPSAHQPLFRWKMRRAAEGGAWAGLVRLHRENPGLVENVYRVVEARGPIAAGEVSTRSGPKGTWWDWDHGKQALELLFWTGRVSARRRASDFARLYDLPERMLPPAVIAAPTPTEAEARAQLLLLAARSLGVATARDLSDYYRQKVPAVRPVLRELVASGALETVTVEGWKEPAYLHPEAALPRRVRARALLSPFDSLVWERARTERLFDFRYRIEIYTPAPKRVYGYYVLPFLLGEHLVARVDLKADRPLGMLRVPAAFAEPGVPTLEVAEALAAELRLMAGWLGLEEVAVGERGDLAEPLRVALAAT